MDTNAKFNVFSIFNTVGLYSRVTVDTPLFQELTRNSPKIPYTTTTDKKGKPLRKFVIAGLSIYVKTVELETTHTSNDGKVYKDTESSLYMKTADAEPIQTNKQDAVAMVDIECE